MFVFFIIIIIFCVFNIGLISVFEEKPHQETGHKRNLSSISTYECPTSPKIARTTKDSESHTEYINSQNELLSPVEPSDVNTAPKVESGLDESKCHT